MVPPISPFAAVFLESLGGLHNLSSLGDSLSFGGSGKGKLPAYLNFHVASGNKSCFTFSQDGLFVISCSLAALFQTTRMCMSYVAAGRGGVLLCW